MREWVGDDGFFGAPVIRKDEVRETPVRHRYVHGSFEGTDTRFVVMLPEPDRWRGRLVQFLQGGMGGSEHQGALLRAPEIAFQLGAAYVESNQGHIGNDLSGLRGQMTVLAWRASAAANRLARHLVAEHYGEPAHHSYVFGGSGGGMRAIECLEQRPDLWDGAVPFIVNRNGLLAFNWSILAFTTAVLGDRVADVVDATDAGGTGDPFAVLDDAEQRDALAALYRAGFCRGAEDQIEPNPLWILGMQLVQRSDPAYFRDFWELRGHAGADRAATVDRMLLAGEAVVASVPTPAELLGRDDDADDLITNVLGRAPADAAFGVVLDGVDRPDRLLGATLRLADGREVLCTGAVGDAVTAILDPVGFDGVQPGDRVTFDNRDLVAFAHFHRHFVSRRYPSMAQFFVDGRPVHPPRPQALDALPVPSGRFEGRMIFIQHGADRECWPSCAQPYAEDVRAQLGDAFDDRFRLWWIEHAAHLVPRRPAGRTRVIEYSGCYAQAVADLVAWVEQGIAPPPSTTYEFDGDGRLVLPDSAEARGGIQPVVRAVPEHIEVAVGETFTITGTIDVPPGSGTVVAAEWDLDGRGEWTVRDPSVDGRSPAIGTTLTHAYTEPGTRFVTLRATSQREGRADDRLRLVTNLARVRVVVSP